MAQISGVSVVKSAASAVARMSGDKETMSRVDYFLLKRPLNNDVFCGDTGIIKQFDQKVFLAILDVLGHGEAAHQVAQVCEDFLEKNYGDDLAQIMTNLDKHIKGTRGAVAGLCILDLERGKVKCVGTGNVTVRKFGSSNIRIIPRGGIIGYEMRTPIEERMNLYHGDILVLHTDGVMEHFDLEDYPAILVDDAKTIATQIIALFGKEHDDACCIALRYQK